MNERQLEQAQAYTERMTQAGIESARKVPSEVAFEVDGKRFCLDCEDPITQARLEANPQAVRCVDCQIDHDRRGR